MKNVAGLHRSDYYDHYFVVIFYVSVQGQIHIL